MKYVYETTFQISRKEVLVFAEFTATGGAPATWDDPAEPMEIEFVKIEIKADSEWIDAPLWIYDIFQNDEDIYAECAQIADDWFNSSED